jgi:hypothetical protein
MKKRIIIETEEKNRILNLHKKFLNEGITDEFPLVGGQDSSATVEHIKTDDSTTSSLSDGYTDKYVREAQRLLNVKDDGKFGPITLKALEDKIKSGSSTVTSTSSSTTTTSTTINMGVVYGTSYYDGTTPQEKEETEPPKEKEKNNSSGGYIEQDVGEF